MESDDVGKSFEDIIRDSWGEEPARFEDSSGEPRRGSVQLPNGRWTERLSDGTWCDSDTGVPLPAALCQRLERLWEEWAPRLPEEIREAVEGPGGGGEAGVREPRRPLPKLPTVAAANPIGENE